LSIKKEMMMKTRIFFMLFAVALLWCGCSTNDDESGAPDDDARLIRVSASAIDVIASQSTRAVVEGETFSGQTARVLATAVGSDYSSLYCNGTMTFSEHDYAYYGTTIEGSRHYPEDEQMVQICGLYPANGWVGINGLEVINTFVSHYVDGASDLMYANTVRSYAYQDGDVLEFYHLLTLLNFKLTKTVDNAIVVEEIILTKMNNNGRLQMTCAVNIVDGASGFSSGMDDDQINAKMVNSDYDLNGYEISIDDDVDAYMLVPPLKNSEVSVRDYTLYVRYSIDYGDTQEATVYLQLYDEDGPYSGSTAGKSFDITLIFKGYKITATASISPWGTGGYASAEI
jgi:hypothetical protein